MEELVEEEESDLSNSDDAEEASFYRLNLSTRDYNLYNLVRDLTFPQEWCLMKPTKQA